MLMGVKTTGFSAPVCESPYSPRNAESSLPARKSDMRNLEVALAHTAVLRKLSVYHIM